MARAASVGALLALAALSSAPTARADAESDAKDLFQRARDLRTKNDCASAVPLFRKAYQIYPNGLGSLRNVAECEEQLGHFAASKRAWFDIKRALITIAQDPKYDGWDKDAQDAATRLQPKVATIYVDVTLKTPTTEGPANDKSGVELSMNSENLGTTLVSTPLDRDPGSYRVRVVTRYAQPAEADVTLVAGETKHVALRLVKTPPLDAVAETPPPVGTTDTGQGKRTAGFVLMGVGAAALIGSGITFLIRSSAKSDVEAACGVDNQHCPSSQRSSLDDTVSRGKTMSTLTSILFPVGLVAGAAGVGLFVWGNSAKETPTTTAGLRVTPGLGRVDATWRF